MSREGGTRSPEIGAFHHFAWYLAYAAVDAFRE
jgi:hypothetical protein